MNNHELLDMIGEADEDYVLAAGDNVVRPRFRWKTAAACAACAALVLCAYPVWKAAQPRDLPLQGIAPLHDYTVVEGSGGTMDTQAEVKVPAGGEIDDALDTMDGESPESDWEYNPSPDAAFVDGDISSDDDGESYMTPEADAAVDEAAASQYDALLRGLGGQGGYEPDTYPGWYGGAWIDHGGGPDAPAWLTVAIVNGFRTDELEAQIAGWCGGEIAFADAKYSLEHLNGLMDPVTAALDGTGLSCGIGVDVTANCLGVDLYSDGASVPNAVLAKLAQLDPAGDAIRVRVFTQSMSTLTDEIEKGPALDTPAAGPVDPDVRAAPVPGGKTEPAPGAVEESGPSAIHDLPEPKEGTQPAVQPAEYDMIYGAAE